MTFQEYLISKKINAGTFSAAEPTVYTNWEAEFPQMHPNSFTVQKLNLINPIRRKYPLPFQPPHPKETEDIKVSPDPVAAPAPKVARPMMKPKPKIS